MSSAGAVYDNPLSAFEDESDAAALAPAAFDKEDDGNAKLQAIAKKDRDIFASSDSGAGSMALSMDDPEDPRARQMAVDEGDDYTTEQVIELFREFDLDGNGMIDAEEMAYMMERLGRPADEESVRQMMLTMDADGNEEVDLEGAQRCLLNSCAVNLTCATC
jgi:hypothetical protein